MMNSGIPFNFRQLEVLPNVLDLFEAVLHLMQIALDMQPVEVQETAYGPTLFVYIFSSYSYT